jgi:hypothetical protein
MQTQLPAWLCSSSFKYLQKQLIHPRVHNRTRNQVTNPAKRKNVTSHSERRHAQNWEVQGFCIHLV